jgi:hypothetical protein
VTLRHAGQDARVELVVGLSTDSTDSTDSTESPEPTEQMAPCRV